MLDLAFFPFCLASTILFLYLRYLHSKSAEVTGRINTKTVSATYWGVYADSGVSAHDNIKLPEHEAKICSACHRHADSPCQHPFH